MNEQKNVNGFETNGQTETQGNVNKNMNYEYAQTPAAQPTVQKEKFVAGIFGALAGSLIGAVCIVILGQFGYIASICGVVMGICALKGYCLLAKGISTKGIVASAVIMIIMVYLSNMFSYGLAVAEVAEVDIITGFLSVPELVSEGMIEGGAYYKDLVMLYIFTALGAVPTIKDYLKK